LGAGALVLLALRVVREVALERAVGGFLAELGGAALREGALLAGEFEVRAVDLADIGTELARGRLLRVGRARRCLEAALCQLLQGVGAAERQIVGADAALARDRCAEGSAPAPSGASAPATIAFVPAPAACACA
jgi:hypothetical protein